MLTSLQNPLVKQLRKLKRGRDRHEQNRFLLEGTHLVEAAYEVGFPLDTVCSTPHWCDRHPELWAQLQAQATRTEQVSEAVLEAIATTVTPDGIVATAPRQMPQQPEESVSLGLMVETLQDPGNLGTIIRTAAAADVEGLWLTADSVDLDHPKVLRASAGQWFRLHMGIASDPIAHIQRCRASGMQIVATLPTAAQSYWDIDLTCPTLFLLGNEGAGLSPAWFEQADLAVTIALANGVESLNVAIATALLVYEARRQRSLRSDA
ncbi:MAG: RNA methyltransferase [Cyanobacteria bacterium J06638_20]